MSSVSSLSSGSVGQNVVLIQPAAKTVQLGQTVSIDCKANRQVARYSGSQYFLAWYHQKTGEAPKLLIYLTSDRVSGISSRFSGSGAGNGVDFTLTISGVQAEDAAVYYCSSGEIILTQSPGSQSVAPGQTVSIRCKTSSSLREEIRGLKADLMEFSSIATAQAKHISALGPLTVAKTMVSALSSSLNSPPLPQSTIPPSLGLAPSLHVASRILQLTSRLRGMKSRPCSTPCLLEPWVLVKNNKGYGGCSGSASPETSGAQQQVNKFRAGKPSLLRSIDCDVGSAAAAALALAPPPQRG
ncbi:hypothetical protein L3Q82_003246 [Scortum barcoo]|uniref:Uncharacterized protein n=1 Tax=Scortum barcoo TaxID=214431 RepID=A0ACB8VRS2_9TELE|nr:hypothetical protein L3Q82_003246 [Scortum barcoo]